MRRVSLMLPGAAYMMDRALAAAAAGVPQAAVQEQLVAEFMQMLVQLALEMPQVLTQARYMDCPSRWLFMHGGRPMEALPICCEPASRPLSFPVVHPLPQPPGHMLQDLTVDAAGLSLAVDIAALFSSAAKVQLLQAQTVQLHLPRPQRSKAWVKLERQAAGRTGAWQLARQCGFALVEAFRSAPSLQTVHLGAQMWRPVLGQGGAVQLDAQLMSKVVCIPLTEDGSWNHFGHVRVNARHYTAEQAAVSGVSLHFRRSPIHSAFSTGLGCAAVAILVPLSAAVLEAACTSVKRSWAARRCRPAGRQPDPGV